MAIDLTRDDLLTFEQAAAILPQRNGKRVHKATIARWRSRGVRGVRLEAARFGGIWYTSTKCLQQFVEALTRFSGLESAPRQQNTSPLTTGITPGAAIEAGNRLNREWRRKSTGIDGR